MPRLSELIKTEKIVLPDSGAIVEVVDRMSYQKAGELRHAAATVEDKTRIGIMAALSIIQSWNILGDDNNPAPITEETLMAMPSKDVDYIAYYGVKLLTEEENEIKKKK